ncbi:MAG: hypothetical protein U0232_14800 [Thermomicrobiales bacterium]
MNADDRAEDFAAEDGEVRGGGRERRGERREVSPFSISPANWPEATPTAPVAGK